MSLQVDLQNLLDAYTARLRALEFRKALWELWALWSRGNAYFNEKQPWVAYKEDRDDAALTMRTCINLIVLFARLAEPIIPFSAARLLELLDVPKKSRGWPAGPESVLPEGAPISVPPVLFRKLTDEDIERWKRRFGAPEDVL